MRTLVLVVVIVMAAGSLSTLLPGTASAAAAPLNPTLSVTVLERTPSGNTTPVFVPARISIPQVPINMTLVFVNNETGSTTKHNLTIANAAGVPVIFTGEILPGGNATVRFTIEALDNVTYRGKSFRPNRTADGGIAFFDADHPATVGEIAMTGGGPIPNLYIEVVGDTVNGKTVFTPSAIIIPQVPIVLHITFLNNQTAASLLAHTFTINDNTGKAAMDTGAVKPQSTASVEFTINSMTSVTFQGHTFQPGPPPSGTDNGTIQFYCIPHVGLGMKGAIMLGTSVPAAGGESKGVFVRAYWIGIIGIASMLVWIGISYYVIKGSSPRFKGNKEHVRKGLP